MDKEGLREVGLDSPALVVDVVVGSIVGENPMNRVVREFVSAMVEHRLDGRTCVKKE